MRKICLAIFALFALSTAYAQSQPENRYRKADRIYIDSQEGHGGAFEWKMVKAGDAKESAEKISQPGYEVKEWMPMVHRPGIIRGMTMWIRLLNLLAPSTHAASSKSMDT